MLKRFGLGLKFKLLVFMLRWDLLSMEKFLKNKILFIKKWCIVFDIKFQAYFEFI